jgi:hypothetical protein
LFDSIRERGAAGADNYQRILKRKRAKARLPQCARERFSTTIRTRSAFEDLRESKQCPSRSRSVLNAWMCDSAALGDAEF